MAVFPCTNHALALHKGCHCDTRLSTDERSAINFVCKSFTSSSAFHRSSTHTRTKYLAQYCDSESASMSKE